MSFKEVPMPDSTPQNNKVSFSCRLEVLLNIAAFCRQVYHSAFGPEEGERRYNALTLVDAVALWREGLPHSRIAPGRKDLALSN
jgi:hypothetical protein